MSKYKTYVILNSGLFEVECICELKESEIINLIKDIPEETKKDSEDKMADRKVMMVRYKTRVERINKDLEHVPDDKQLLKEKEEAIKKYNFYKNNID